MQRSPLALHLPDADALTGAEIAAALDLSPAAFLCLVYTQWPEDKGVAQQVSNLVRALKHDRLYVRFHADPHPPGYAKKIGGPREWGKLAAKRMGQYYGTLGVQLHAILANEVDADYEGGLGPEEASDWFRDAISGYRSERTEDVIHVPAPTGAPETHRRYLEQYKADGWVAPSYVIDGHGYDGDLENVVNVLSAVFPHNRRIITETNDLADFGWPADLIRQGQVDDVVYFVLNWARGGIGRVQPPSADDAAKQMSLLRFPARYQQFRATVAGVPAPPPEPEPESIPMPEKPDPWEHWSADEIARVAGCPIESVTEHWPRLVEQLDHCGINDRAVQTAMIGTVAIESASTFAPVRESFWLDEEWRRANLRYYPFYGRGFIQITWESNYATYGPKIAALWGAGGHEPDFDLVSDPDRALNPDISAAVAALYFRDHGGGAIPVAARAGDWREVRRLVQGADAGLDRLISIAAALGGTTPPVATERMYGADIPDGVVHQQNSWSCAVRATYAALWAMSRQGHGPAVTYGDSGPRDVYDWLVPRYDGVNVGLLDHTGAGLAEALRSHGYAANHYYPVSLAAVRELAGGQPILLGGDGWHHWTMVRGRTNDGGLILENPSPGHAGINDYLRDSWDRLGPMAAVVIDLVPVVEPAPPVDIDSLRNLVGTAFNEDGVVVPALAAALANPDDVNLRMQAASVLKWLRENAPKAG